MQSGSGHASPPHAINGTLPSSAALTLPFCGSELHFDMKVEPPRQPHPCLFGERTFAQEYYSFIACSGTPQVVCCLWEHQRAVVPMQKLFFVTVLPTVYRTVSLARCLVNSYIPRPQHPWTASCNVIGPGSAQPQSRSCCGCIDRENHDEAEDVAHINPSLPACRMLLQEDSLTAAFLTRRIIFVISR